MAMAKASIRKAKQDGFNISVKATGVTLVDGGEFPDLNDIEMERLRTLWTEVSEVPPELHITQPLTSLQIVDVMHSRGAWASLITDGSYYFVCRRSADIILDDSPNPRVFNFVLSPLLGNRGLVNLGAPPDDLQPIHAPRHLIETPVGFWVAFSYDQPSDPALLTAPSRPLSPAFPAENKEFNGITKCRRVSKRLKARQIAPELPSFTVGALYPTFLDTSKKGKNLLTSMNRMTDSHSTYPLPLKSNCNPHTSVLTLPCDHSNKVHFMGPCPQRLSKLLTAAFSRILLGFLGSDLLPRTGKLLWTSPSAMVACGMLSVLQLNSPHLFRLPSHRAA